MKCVIKNEKIVLDCDNKKRIINNKALDILKKYLVDYKKQYWQEGKLLYDDINWQKNVYSVYLHDSRNQMYILLACTKINKNISIICLIFTIISGGLTIFLYPYNELRPSIASSIFTGFIVSTVVALIGYFYEKQKIINNISDNLKSLYMNLLAIKIL